MELAMNFINLMVVMLLTLTFTTSELENPPVVVENNTISCTEKSINPETILQAIPITVTGPFLCYTECMWGSCCTISPYEPGKDN
jgi:hypothetical protein